MQRIIKFRAWDKRQKKMVNVCQMNFRTNYDVFRIWGDGDWTGAEKDSRQEGRLINPDDTDLMQFTGLHDKNGTPVFEGDIIRDTWTGKTGAVEYDTQEGEWNRIWDCATTKGKYGGGEVIGNIYENPDLLKQ